MATAKTGIRASAKTKAVTRSAKPVKSTKAGGKGRTASAAVKATPKKPKKLSKYGEWCLAHPNGYEITYIDWKAVMK